MRRLTISRMPTMTDPCPSWPEYRTTVFLSDETPPWPAFAIVTACNPLGVVLDEADNRQRDEALLASLHERGLRPLRAIGCSPDLSHREPGWAVPMGRAEAIALGREFDQDAVYWVSDDSLWLLSCPPRVEAAERLGGFEERLVGVIGAVAPRDLD